MEAVLRHATLALRLSDNPSHRSWGTRGSSRHRTGCLTSAGDARPVNDHLTHCTDGWSLPEALLPEAVRVSFSRLRVERQTDRQGSQRLAWPQDGADFFFPPILRSLQPGRMHLVTAVPRQWWRCPLRGLESGLLRHPGRVSSSQGTTWALVCGHYQPSIFSW